MISLIAIIGDPRDAHFASDSEKRQRNLTRFELERLHGFQLAIMLASTYLLRQQIIIVDASKV